MALFTEQRQDLRAFGVAQCVGRCRSGRGSSATTGFFLRQ